MTPSAEIKPGPHWWKASALTTRPTLPPFGFVRFRSVAFVWFWLPSIGVVGFVLAKVSGKLMIITLKLAGGHAAALLQLG